MGRVFLFAPTKELLEQRAQAHVMCGWQPVLDASARKWVRGQNEAWTVELEVNEE
jgi:hypothetical protein